MRSSVRAAFAALVLCASCKDARLLKVDSAPILAPHVIDFGLISIHDQAVRQVKLVNGGRAPLRVNGLSIELTNGAQSLTSASARPPFAASPTQQIPLTLTSNQSTSIEVAFVPNGPGPIRGLLKVNNDSNDDPEASIELRGEAVDAQARFSPGQLDFGKIEVGTEAMQALTVTNDSPLPVTVTPTTVGQDGDEFHAEPLTVPAKSALQLPVTFAPTRLGHVASALAVTRCAGCQADVINLYGEGIDSAMVVDPNPMNFGSVPVDASGQVSCRMINVSSVPLELKGIELDPGTDASYTLLQTVPDYILPPGAWLATSIRFTPTHMGQAGGALLVHSSSKRHPTVSVPLIGRGGGAEIAVAPDRIDFGDVPVGGEATATVHIRNAGTNGDTLTINAVSFAGSSDFRLSNQSYPVALTAGQALDVTVFFDPSQAAPLGGQLTVDSSDGSSPQVVIPVTGSGRSVMPCQFALSPNQLDFGNVPPGSGAVLGLRFTNQGQDVCAVRNVHVEQNADGAFFMPGGSIPSLLLYPGDSFQTQIAFKPHLQGLTLGKVVMTVTDPSSPSVSMSLKGQSLDACLTAAPPFIDFGPLRRDCSHANHTTHLVNACAAPIDVGSAWIGAGTSSEFSLVSPPSMPMTLAPGAGFNLTVGYTAQQQGQNFSPLYVAESDVVDAPLLVPLLGEGLPDGNTTDHFVQADGTKADVLFVVDNSNSMAEEQPRLQAAIPAFVQAARSKGMDLHVAVTTTGIDPVTVPGCGGGAQGGEAGRLYPVDHSAPRIIDLTQQTPEQLVQNNVNVGQCHHLEQGLEALRRALSDPLVDNADDPVTPAPQDGNLGFLRDDAQLSVVVVSDEDDHSGDEVNDYATFLRGVHGLTQPQRVGFFAIAPISACPTSSGSSAPRYTAMAQATGGQVWDACDTDYGPALSAIAERSFGAQSRFPLTQLADPSTLAVIVDGQAATNWTYDPSTNAVVFGQAPAPGAHVDVSYKQLCPP